MRRWRHWLRIAAILIMLAAGGGFLFAWSGLYNVAASSGHFAITEWLLAFVMQNSAEARAPLVNDPPPLDDPALIRLGAAHFQIECVSCHGAPGIKPSPVMQAALPAAPYLAAIDLKWSDKELFWVVQHGIKYTGMPGWPTLQREDEVWALVAFLKDLGRLDATAYRDLAFNTVAEADAKRRIADGNLPDMAQQCFRCHGSAEAAPISALVPSLNGQSPDYLVAALAAYAEGTRPSGIMQPMAATLGDDDRRKLAEFYAGRPKLAPASTAGSATDLGRTIAVDGIPDKGIPACLSCHGHDADASFPRLAGQSAPYLANQLRLWRKGVNTATPGAEIMAPIAQRLDEAAVDAVAAYFASLADDSAGSPP